VRTWPLDFAGHVARLKALLTEAREKGVQVLALPELVLSGYECGDFFWHPWVSEAAWDSLQAVLPETTGLFTAIGLPLRIGDRLYNAAALALDGKLLGFALKTELPKDSIFYEPRWFVPGPRDALLKEARTGLPAGPFVVEVDGVRMAVEICEEAWRPHRTVESLAPHIVLGLNASPYEIGKPARRHRLVSESSYRYRCAYLYANLLGNEAGKLLYDGESLIAYQGQIIAATKPFSLAEYELAIADIDLDPLSTTRLRSGFPAGASPLVSFPHFQWKEPAFSPGANPSVSPLSDEMAVTQAISMGLWDYLYKTRHKGFVVSLSGGLDSAACAVFGYLSIQRAQTEIPSESLSAYGSLSPHQLKVYTFYQATRQSSEETFRRAQGLAKALGTPFARWEIQPIVEAYEALVSSWLGRPLSWEEDDIARQNLQARVRVPGIWMVANLMGALLLTTGNRSEITVGYTTMDGDSAGGLAPIGGLSKPFLKKWALWAADFYHWPILAEIAEATPTAELRPHPQADETDLMPYPLLTFLEDKLLWEGHPPSTLPILAKEHFAQLSLPELRQYSQRFIRLFAASQWKRERLAPAFHLDKYDLDPRGAARFPILHALKSEDTPPIS
jgi:NAD+ synthase (glutamine-hydrolysing)